MADTSDSTRGRSASTGSNIGDGPAWVVRFVQRRTGAERPSGAVEHVEHIAGPDAGMARLVFSGEVVMQLDPNTPRWTGVDVVRCADRSALLTEPGRTAVMDVFGDVDDDVAATILAHCAPNPIREGMRPDPAGWPTLEHAPTDDDGPVTVVHLMKFAAAGGSSGMSTYQEAAGRLVKQYGGGPVALFTVRHTLHGDGPGWDEVRFVAYPSLRAFFAMVADPERVAAQTRHRDAALEHTHTVVVRPALDRFLVDGPT